MVPVQMSPEDQARLHELGQRHNDGALTAAELVELTQLTKRAQELPLANAREALRRADPESFRQAQEAECRLVQRQQPKRQGCMLF